MFQVQRWNFEHDIGRYWNRGGPSHLPAVVVCHACALILIRVAIVFTKRDQLLGYRGQSVGIRREMETVSEGSGTYTVKNNATTLYMSVFQHFLLKNVFFPHPVRESLLRSEMVPI